MIFSGRPDDWRRGSAERVVPAVSGVPVAPQPDEPVDRQGKQDQSTGGEGDPDGIHTKQGHGVLDRFLRSDRPLPGRA
ncbi:msr8715 [Mesorhizobium japonicum MAFF 303099]|uniref:Msr8715 protein n=1 Tax=Mesorhizobium japonicum (strain LMG 29417 / CECT 9101 / MAFF 303099) TaxID=266835 RepID=Q986G5_RHILO|nr:msr8715 [Mesorhizobium japonicum MAFF 303099]